MLILGKLAGLLLTPPGIVLLVALLGFILGIRWQRAGVMVIGAAFTVLLVFSLPVTGYRLIAALESGVSPLAAPSPQAARRQADAIVVLGGGRVEDAAEYGGDTVNGFTLERLRYAVRLHRATGLPLLLSGGSPAGETIPEAALMRQTLAQDFHVPAKWIEGKSRTTYENALYTKVTLAGAGIRRVYLVTHAWHMPRAMWAFAQHDLDPIMAPTLAMDQDYGVALLDYLPSARGLALSSRALNEWLGLLWYKYRHSVVRRPLRQEPAPIG